jgi:hypothetical protein
MDNPRADDDYRVIGRYVVKFSELVLEMRFAMVQKLSERAKQNNDLAALALSESSAAPIASAFFAMCAHVAWIDWDSPDGKVLRALSEQIQRAIRKRNDIAHGDWHVSEVIPLPASLYRTDTRRKMPLAWEPIANRRDVERLTAELVELQSIVKHVGKACLYAKFQIPRSGDELLTPTLAIRKIGKGKNAENIVVRRQDEPEAD